MLFNSYEFLIFFPIVCLIYFVIPKKCQQIWLLITSYYFYMCWNAKYILLILFVTVVTYICGILLGDFRDKKGEKRKIFVIVGFVLCLLLLFVYKYLNFFGNTCNFVFSQVGFNYRIRSFDIILPVGISFYTFQALSYLVDVYRGEVKTETNFVRFALFVSFFPQLVAGPIERSKNLLCQINEEHSFDYDRMRKGLLYMIWGFFLKLVIADRAAIYVDKVYANPGGFCGEFALLAAIYFSIQIYCDFSGYSCIAIGAAKVMGFSLMENFNHPYLSTSVEQFWRNWHISLTSWFRDYLYIPLGGNRKGKIRKYINIMIVFLVSGLWHGAGWHFVVWGGLNGLYQIVGEMLSGVKKVLLKLLGIRDNSKILNFFKIIFTCVLIGISWIFFRSDSMNTAMVIIRNILNIRVENIFELRNVFKDVISYKQSFVLILSIIVLLIADILKKRNVDVIQIIINKKCPVRWFIYIFAIMFVLIFGVWGPEYSASSFIYFQF